MKQLSNREKYAISLAMISIIVYVVVQFIATPFMENREQMSRAIETRSRTLDEMVQLKTEYDRMQKKAETARLRFAKRSPNFTLFSFLDNLAGNAGIKDHIAYMKPSTSDKRSRHYKVSMVEMKVAEINLKQLIPYLHMIETSENSVFIKRISIIKSGKSKEYIDVVMQVETYEI